MATDKRIIASPTEEGGTGFRYRAGGGSPLTITGLHSTDGPKAAVGRYVDIQFDSYTEARSFARSILRFVGDPENED